MESKKEKKEPRQMSMKTFAILALVVATIGLAFALTIRSIRNSNSTTVVEK